ncbi:DUF202 domain-containing protein [Glutamicibacter sp.]|uniref:DUF202 domain-containing protein n=1 Tax=Glutamicibacter sp. TaxID=1931995 RepID=UPI0028BE5519|nr:DUF202 domain-containing protein [Glutamicibacter sp.]
MGKRQIPIADPGLQPERTVLSWGRTLLSFLVVSVVLMRWLPHYGQGVLIPTGLGIFVGLLIYLTQVRRYRFMAHGLHAERVPANVASVLTMSLAIVVLACCALVLVVLDL